MATVLHPKGDRITVLRDPPKQKSEGGIDIGNAVVDDHEVGTILEVGTGILRRELGDNQEVTMAYLEGKYRGEYNQGDRVLYSRFSGMDATIGGKNIRILSEGEIIGVLEGEGE